MLWFVTILSASLVLFKLFECGTYVLVEFLELLDPLTYFLALLNVRALPSFLMIRRRGKYSNWRGRRG